MKYEIGREGEYQLGSNEEVLVNKLGIVDPEEMIDVESELLNQLYLHIFQDEEMLGSVSFSTIKHWHKAWLLPIYSWAGELRTVDMTKNNFRFAAAKFLHKQIQPFEKRFLSEFQQLVHFSFDDLIELLAQMHIEFILIHPFREGNGRISRLLNDVFVTKAGYKPLDYQLWNEHKDYYFAAIQAGVAGEPKYMERLMRDCLQSQF